MKIKQTKSTNKLKPLYILISFIAVFVAFVTIITRPSKQAEAIEEVQLSSNKKDVESIWTKYKVDLYKNPDFLFAIRSKLVSFNLSEKENAECIQWLPPAPECLNVIVIPDLSRRIIDTLNNPQQVINDKMVLNVIWQNFVKYTKLKQNSTDKLSLNVTDVHQAKGQFSVVADSLQFDLSDNKGKSNILYFNKQRDNRFKSGVDKMYLLAQSKPLGADYRFYFRRYLEDQLKKSNLFTTYKNKVIIITDGYLEPEDGPADTKIYSYEKILYPSVENGTTLDIIHQNHLEIANVNIDLRNTDVLVCEVNERKTGIGFDYEILKAYWGDWLKRMNVKNFAFIQREQASLLTAKKIEEFFKI